MFFFRSKGVKELLSKLKGQPDGLTRNGVIPTTVIKEARGSENKHEKKCFITFIAARVAIVATFLLFCSSCL